MHVEWQALPDVDSNMSAQVPAHQPVILHAPAAPPQAQRSTRVEAAAQSSSSVCETNRSRAPAPHTVPTSNSRVVRSVPEPVTVPVHCPDTNPQRAVGCSDAVSIARPIVPPFEVCRHQATSSIIEESSGWLPHQLASRYSASLVTAAVQPRFCFAHR